MEVCSPKTKIIRKFILDNVSLHPTDIVKVVAQKFAISRQAAARHLKKLTTQGEIETEGNTSGRIYRLHKGRIAEFSYRIADRPSAEEVYTADILPLLVSLPSNVQKLWAYCFEEIFSNGTSHSKGTNLTIRVIQKKLQTTINVIDDGIGIFNSIKKRHKLDNDEHAALLLSNSTFQKKSDIQERANIFLSSRMTSSFTIVSKRVVLTHQQDISWDWTLGRTQEETPGTFVNMVITNDNLRSPEEIIDEYKTSRKELLARTCIPVKLVDYCAQAPFSRSQARRVLSRIDKFKIAILDFIGVEEIGPAFADQVFRVFSLEHPEIEVLYTNANKQVEAVIKMARENSSGTA